MTGEASPPAEQVSSSSSASNGHGFEAPPFIRRFDGWANTFTALGVDLKDSSRSTTFGTRKPQDRSQLETLYEQDELVHLVVDRIPEHATRRWIKVTGAMDDSGRPDQDFGRQVIEALELVDAQTSVFDLTRVHRLYGGAAILVGADDGQDTDKPLNLDNLKTVNYLEVLSRYEITPRDIDEDPKSPTYRKPLFYEHARGANTGGNKIHHSRIIRLKRHMIATDTSSGARNGWDNSVIERVYDPIKDFESIFGYTNSIVQSLVQGVLKIPSLAQMLSAEDGSATVANRVQNLQFLRSIINMIVIDSKEEFDLKVSPISGLAELIVRYMDRLAAAAEMPLSILFGQPPTGLSTDDESGRTTFYDSIANFQKRLLRPVITYLIDLVIHAKNGLLKGKFPPNWSFEFLPLLEPSQKENADRELVMSGVDKINIENGTLSPEEARSRLVNDPQCPYQLDLSRDIAAEELGDPSLALAPDAATGAPTEGAEVVVEPLNGAQAEAAVGILEKVAARALPRDAGVGALQVFFRLTRPQAELVFASVGKTFFSAPIDAKAPPDGGSEPPPSDATPPNPVKEAAPA